MLSKAGPLLLIFFTLLLSLTEARLSLLERWLPSDSSASLSASSNSTLDEQIYARASARVKRQGGENLPGLTDEIVQGGPCAPADPPPEQITSQGPGPTECIPFPSPEELGGQPTSGPAKRWLSSLWARAPKPVQLVARNPGRARQILRDMEANPDLRNHVVPTNEAWVTFWTTSNGEVDLAGGLATENLCGCSVVVITSPFAAILAHVIERRADGQLWWREPDGEAQRRADQEFVANGENMVRNVLNSLHGPQDNVLQPPTAENSWNGWFPADRTRIDMVVPVWNQEYYGTGYQYPDQDLIPNIMRGGFVYENQHGALIDRLNTYLGTTEEGQTATWTYRRRYGDMSRGGDPAHLSDGRDIVIVAPRRDENGAVVASLVYDDEHMQNVNVLAAPPPPPPPPPPAPPAM